MKVAPAKSRLPLESILQDSEDYWIRRNAAVWLLRLLEFDTEIDDNFFNCCGWIGGGTVGLLEKIRNELRLPKGRTRELGRVREDLKALESFSNARASRALERIYIDNPVARQPLRDFCICHLEAWLKSNPDRGKSIFPRGFASLFGLDAKAMEFCAFVWALGNYNAIEYYFEDTLSLCSNQNFPILARMLNMANQRFRIMLGGLIQLGIIEHHHSSSLRLADNMDEALSLGCFGQFRSFFCRPLNPTDVPLSDFRLSEEEKRHILALLGQRNSKPAHLLLYGAPGTGKSSFASRIVQQLGVDAWAVACREQDSVKDRRLALMACIHLSALHPGSIILVDEAEMLLDTDNPDFEKGSSKAWLNDLLERKGLRIIWITNRVDHLDQAVRRRFSFSVHFETPGRKESISMWNMVACRLGVEDRFPITVREKFADLYKVPVAVMEQALRQARSLAGKRNFSGCVERILKAHLRLAQDGMPLRKMPEAFAEYNPELISAAMSPEELLARLGRLGKRIDRDAMRGVGNLLFYGPPGTGKTAFAKYIARKLEYEYIVCKASDLISPYVGETEQKIAAVFARAENEKALLLIDEADSFIFGRENAHYSWEQTMVNEFLTALENFNGVCICTTNYRKIIDGAAMRRFPFKICFKYSSGQALAALYDLCLAPLVGSKPQKDIYDVLCAQKRLTPGDFQVVRAQFWLEEGGVSHRQLLDALLHEQALKLENEAKSIGF